MTKLNELPRPEDLISVPEFAARIKRDKKTVYQWIRDKQMPPGTVYRILGEYRLDFAEFEKTLVKRVN